MAKSEIIPDILRNVPLFNALEQSHLELIAASCELMKLARGENIFRRGTNIQTFYYLLSGGVKIFAMSKDGAEKVIHIAAPGETFGEAAMFLGTAVPVGTQAIHESVVLALPKTAIYQLIEEDPRIAHLMLAGMSMRMHRLIQDIEAMSLQSATERVIGYLLQFCSDQQETQNIVLPAKKATIASLLNLTPETLSRTLAKLEKLGLISVNATEIHIPDCKRLRSATLI